MALSAIMMVQATTSSISVNPRWFFLVARPRIAVWGQPFGAAAGLSPGVPRL